MEISIFSSFHFNGSLNILGYIPFPSYRIATHSLLNEGLGRFLLVCLHCIAKAFVRPPIQRLLVSENRGHRACSHGPLTPFGQGWRTWTQQRRKKGKVTPLRKADAWKTLLQFLSLNFLCVNSPKIKAGITGRNGAANALQEIKLDHNFSY